MLLYANSLGLTLTNYLFVCVMAKSAREEDIVNANMLSQLFDYVRAR